jgi:hypothetical protein
MRILAWDPATGDFLQPDIIDPASRVVGGLDYAACAEVYIWIDGAQHGDMIRAGGLVFLAVSEDLLKHAAESGRYSGGRPFTEKPAEIETPGPAVTRPPKDEVSQDGVQESEVQAAGETTPGVVG